MSISIKKLTTDRIKDFKYFFDHDAFSDHQEWADCYCLECHLKKEEDESYIGQESRSRKAEELIREGIMNGYLIYDDERVIGWCNAGDKVNYAVPNPVSDQGKILVLACMDIAPDYRGRGLANLVIERVLADAKETGYSYVEGYPYTDLEDPYQYKGPKRLYDKYGFEVFKETAEFYVMRKEI